jgi:alkanesulfonate monooxygenase SsuD/methylene tetrahydromethanopterin reductase-like flavin-dependent oxidoreductase (luciferase family)
MSPEVKDPARALTQYGAGWDGVFLWDHVTWNPAWGGTPPMADPWICLAAAATATFRVLLRTVVTPLPRRRPQIVARQVVTLDHLSGGRAVLGVGIGEDFGYEAYGESVHAPGACLDEGLEIVTRLLSVDKCGSCTPSTDGIEADPRRAQSPTICGCSMLRPE